MPSGATAFGAVAGTPSGTGGGSGSGGQTTGSLAADEVDVLVAKQKAFTDHMAAAKSLIDQLKKTTDATQRAAILKQLAIQTTTMTQLESAIGNPGATARVVDRLQNGMGDDARYWSLGWKYAQAIKYGLEHGMLEESVMEEAQSLLNVLHDPEAAAEFIAMLGAGMAIKRGVCAAGKGSVVGPWGSVALGVGEAAATTLKISALVTELNGVTFEAEIKDVAPQAMKLTVELLKDHAFLAWVKKFTCFPAGTQVVQAQTLEPGQPIRYRMVAIETLKAGDLVLAREEFGPGIKLQHIEETFQRKSDHLRVLEFVDSTGRMQTLKTTDEHPFWIAERRVFLPARELTVGMTVLGPNEERQSLVATRREEHADDVLVYNFRVAKFHTYFVSATADNLPLLVHNAKYKGPQSANAAPNNVDPAATRPKLRKATKERAKAAAPKTETGDYIDPNEKIVVPKEGPFDYGHPNGQEWWRTQEQARHEGWTRKRVIEVENAKQFQIEDPSSNRSHRHEKPR